MSPDAPPPADSDLIELVILPRARDIDQSFTVRRSLPFMKRRMVGPFIFFDHMGPTHLREGAGMDVRPHPHIGLATVTYLFDGELVHRDSLGSLQPIRPGDVNWMAAGRGITHSERSPLEQRAKGAHAHGIQSWVALPVEHEEMAPTFEHHEASALPLIVRDGVRLHLIAGTAFGERAPTTVLWPTLYVHAELESGARLELDTEHAERAVYVVEGAARIAERTFEAGAMVVLREGAPALIEAIAPARLMLVGGASFPEPRYIDWNFVSSRKDRLTQAKDDWEAGRFPTIPGDDTERIAYPAPRR